MIKAMSKLNLVALSREPISERFVFELKGRAIKLGIMLHTVGGQTSNGTYYIERWESSEQLDLTQRESLRSIAAVSYTHLTLPTILRV